jgi:hypothetical protein
MIYSVISERSEESLFDVSTRTNKERFFASLRMAAFLVFPQPGEACARRNGLPPTVLAM